MKKSLLSLLIVIMCSVYTNAQYLNWVKQITGAQTNYVKGMAIDGSGNIYLAGAFTGTIDVDPSASTVSVTAQGGYDIWFAKYTSAGAYAWHKTIAGGGDEWATDIALDNSGNIFITGWYNSLAPALDFDPDSLNSVTFTTYDGGFVAKYTSAGAFIWRTVIGGTSSDVTKMNAVAVDGSGNVYVGGSISGNNTTVLSSPTGTGTVSLNPSNGNIYYAKYSGSNGNTTWAKCTGANNNTAASANDISLDGSTNIYISGVFSGTTDFNPDASSTNRASSSGSAFTAKYNSSGTFSWSALVTGQNGDEAYENVVDGSGNVYVTGKSNANNQDIFLAKFNSSGTQQWKVSPGSASGEDQGQTVTLDASGNVYMSGYFTGTGANINFNPLSTAKNINLTSGQKDFFMSKYNTSGHLQWVDNLNVTLSAGARQVNASAISSGNLIIAGALNGSGSMDPACTSSTLNATTDNGFFGSYTANPLSIGGPSLICSTGGATFTLTNIPAGATVTWTASPSGLFTVSSGSGTTATLYAATGTTSGQGIMTFTITTACGSAQTSITVWVGVPADPGTVTFTNPVNGMSYWCSTHSGNQFWLDPMEPIMAYEVRLLAYPELDVFRTNEYGVPGGDDPFSYVPNGFYVFEIRSTNACGSTGWFGTEIEYVDCLYERESNNLTAYPNPADNYVAVDFAASTSVKTGAVQTYEYIVFDNAGIQRLQGSASTKSKTIDTSSLTNGHYIVQIIADGKTTMRRIVVNR